MSNASRLITRKSFKLRFRAEVDQAVEAIRAAPTAAGHRFNIGSKIVPELRRRNLRAFPRGFRGFRKCRIATGRRKLYIANSEMPDAQSIEPRPMFSERLKRYIPLVVWGIAVLTILLIPLKIVSYGYIPDDESLRHAAKAVFGKPWSEILVMRSDFPLDFHQGWHAILGWIHRSLNADAETLVVMSVVSLMVLVSLSALVWLRRPEAWLAALMAGVMRSPVFSP